MVAEAAAVAQQQHAMLDCGGWILGRAYTTVVAPPLVPSITVSFVVPPLAIERPTAVLLRLGRDVAPPMIKWPVRQAIQGHDVYQPSPAALLVSRDR